MIQEKTKKQRSIHCTNIHLVSIEPSKLSTANCKMDAAAVAETKPSWIQVSESTEREEESF
jgi:tRNA U34 5-methylaminomethyl-2-thiouridine-forming methyltransferase MnmC